MDSDYIKTKLWSACVVAVVLGILIGGGRVLHKIVTSASQQTSHVLPKEEPSTPVSTGVEETPEAIPAPFQVPVKIDNESFPVEGALRFIDEEMGIVCYTYYQHGISCVKR